ncbi:RNA-directed DNA polymerase from mobile element jockey-like [Brachionus plicatilis]|uniref:RNA-directed DNA polymerase from mobile element jockey-like n=1 Tax=Brachionus plicatilis TaxID=10195 RepID=A0A3M7Q895_BRAPC|nr:RNA-directed DNA polymerase from mobile element jockey-like [Brachionus plicatilis]
MSINYTSWRLNIKISKSKLSELKAEYERLFNEKLRSNNEDEEKASKTVGFVKQYGNKVLEARVKIDELKIIKRLRDLANGKAPGPAGVIKPLIKDLKKNHSCISNLRPITVSDPLATIYEKILLLDVNRHHDDNPKQFGFKKNSSCAHAKVTLRETALFNRCLKRKTYMCAIDASKAFDKVVRNYLWVSLIDKLPPHITLSLVSYYKQSHARIENNNEVSTVFKTNTGVKQGGPLSQRLFSIYIEDLVKVIEEGDEGVQIGSTKIDILLYADDILLISSTKKGLQALVTVTENFGEQKSIKFNPEKNFVMIFGGKKITRLDIRLDSKKLNQVNEINYLGAHINTKLTNRLHVAKKLTASNLATLNLKKSIITASLDYKIKAQIYTT